MWDFLRTVLIYLLGGVTFLPLALLAIFVHGALTLERVPQEGPSDLLGPGDDGSNASTGAGADPKLQRSQEKEHAAYYAVTREYVPGGMASKPPERPAQSGDAAREESPSVYQSMYRSLFDRKHGPTMEVGKGNGRVFRANHSFYVVLRHGHLMLYDDAEQLEVRYVISLAQHVVSVYGGDGEIPEGELWIKRNAIRLSRRPGVADSVDVLSKPFFLFSDNCSEKEDLYFAMLQSQERNGADENPPPLVQHYETKHIISLVQRLHSSEEQLQARWFNALLGRLFLSLYKTQTLEDFVRAKITKKIARAKKPGFLSGIVLQKIDLGNAAPFITNPRLKDLTVDGDCCAEADVHYDGKFRIELAATVRIDLGARFKPRDVTIVLAITLKKLEGHLLVKFKPPPSNRIWFSFDKMPQMDLAIEPIVSSRQVTYNIILRAIESRIREVFAETLVVPHWDDIPFTSSIGQFFRGGIWVNERRDFQPPTETIVPDEDHSNVDAEGADKGLKMPSSPASIEDEKTASNPALVEGQRQRFFGKRGMKSTPTLPVDPTIASSSSIQRSSDPPPSLKSKPSSAAGPVISIDNANRDTLRSVPRKRSSKDAASIMSEISGRSAPSSPGAVPASPNIIPPTPGEETAAKVSGSSASSLQSSEGETESKISATQSDTEKAAPKQYARPARAATTTFSQANTSNDVGIPDHPPPTPTKLQSLARTLTPSEKKQAAIGSAALAARNWGWKTLSKTRTPTTATAGNSGTSHDPTMPHQHDPSNDKADDSAFSEKLGSPNNPIGRGQPLPPPGQPLPLPEKEKRRSSSYQIPARKPVQNASDKQMDATQKSTTLKEKPRSPSDATSISSGTAEKRNSVNESGAPPLPQRDGRLQQKQKRQQQPRKKAEDLFIVAAPESDADTHSEGDVPNYSKGSLESSAKLDAKTRLKESRMPAPTSGSSSNAQGSEGETVHVGGNGNAVKSFKSTKPEVHDTDRSNKSEGANIGPQGQHESTHVTETAHEEYASSEMQQQRNAVKGSTRAAGADKSTFLARDTDADVDADADVEDDEDEYGEFMQNVPSPVDDIKHAAAAIETSSVSHEHAHKPDVAVSGAAMAAALAATERDHGTVPIPHKSEPALNSSRSNQDLKPEISLRAGESEGEQADEGMHSSEHENAIQPRPIRKASEEDVDGHIAPEHVVEHGTRVEAEGWAEGWAEG